MIQIEKTAIKEILQINLFLYEMIPCTYVSSTYHIFR